MLDIVENDFNIVKDNTSLLEAKEIEEEEVYDSSLTLLAEEFNYMEIL